MHPVGVFALASELMLGSTEFWEVQHRRRARQGPVWAAATRQIQKSISYLSGVIESPVPGQHGSRGQLVLCALN